MPLTSIQLLRWLSIRLLISIKSYLKVLSSLYNNFVWKGKLVMLSGGCRLQNESSRTTLQGKKVSSILPVLWMLSVLWIFDSTNTHIKTQYTQTHFPLVLLAEHFIKFAFRVQWDWTYEKGEIEICLSCHHNFMQRNCNTTWYISSGKIQRYPDPSHVIRLFCNTFLFLPANVAVFQIRQHTRQMGWGKGHGRQGGTLVW